MILLLAFIGLLAMEAFASNAVNNVWPVTDQRMKKSLSGTWSLKVVDGVDTDTPVPEKDASWSEIPVPGTWEQYGLAKPSYDKARPLTGYYRTTFTVPDEWRGQRVVLRLDGVLYGYDLWVNGKQAGTWRSAYNTALFDITDCLRRGARQELAMRVITVFPGSDFDYNDDWAPCGIFRDVTLMAVPQTHLSDLTITTRLTGEVLVDTKIANADRFTSIVHEILDAQSNVVGTDRVEHPHLWTAETPYLYTLRTRLVRKGKTLQQFTHKFGFRELTIDGSVLRLNGTPIKLRGVTCHSTDPRTVKVIGDTLTLKDMRLMKEAGVNYIRTSHYPREPRFYELADSLGFYVISEVPFGRGEKNLYKKEFYPMLQQRAKATVWRDKNHASVLVWSLGNENPLTDICVRLGEYVKTELDTSRPICYPQVGSYFRKFNYDFPQVADIYSPHYPTTGQVGGFYQRADRPVIFTEYLHTLGISFEDHDRQWEIIEKTPCIAGGSVWEWVDQGMPFRGHRADRYGYEEKVYTSPDGGFEMAGNKGTDGLLYADRTPLPNYYELQHNYAQAFVKIENEKLKIEDGRAANLQSSIFNSQSSILNLQIVNRYDFLNLKDNVGFHWALTADRDTIATGVFSPDCAPHSTVPYRLQLPAVNPAAIAILHVEVTNRQGWTLQRQAFHLSGAYKEPEAAVTKELPVQRGPLVRVGRKATMCERLKVREERIDRYLQPLQNAYVTADVTREGTTVSYTLTPDTTRRFLSEMGVAWLLSPEIDRVQWIGQGPFATYPGRCKANRYGLWSMHKDDLYFEGNRMGVEVCWFSDKDGRGILISGDSLNINFEQTDLGLVVTVNAAVSGQGPKFAKTAFGVWSNEVGQKTGTFRMQATHGGHTPRPFADPQSVAAPFSPFYTLYDTYLMRFDDIYQK